MASAWDSYTHIMFAFIDGRDATPSAYVGYLLTSDATAGTYTSMFWDNGGAQDLRDISHISALVRGEVIPTPLPPALLLFGSALAGLGYLARRRRTIALKMTAQRA